MKTETYTGHAEFAAFRSLVSVDHDGTTWKEKSFSFYYSERNTNWLNNSLVATGLRKRANRVIQTQPRRSEFITETAKANEQ